MSSPVELSDLDSIPTGAVLDTDDMLVRRGLTDYRATAGQVRSLNLPGFSPLAGGGPVGSDLMLVNRGGVNYQTPFSSIGLVKGTICYFYQLAAPVGWTIVPNTGDRILAVSDGTNQYASTAAGSPGGTWQQTGWALLPNQLPPHNHLIPAGKDSSDSPQNPGFARRATTSDPSTRITSFGGNGLNGDLHNHGNTWRPFANVGILAVKDN